MTLKALRTRSALKLAPWLKPKGREWTISGNEIHGLRNIVVSSRSPFRGLDEPITFPVAPGLDDQTKRDLANLSRHGAP
jgi:hypothetical protein